MDDKGVNYESSIYQFNRRNDRSALWHGEQLLRRQIGPDEARFLETVPVVQSGDDEEDKIASRVAVPGDCAIVYTTQSADRPPPRLLPARCIP